MPLLLAPDDEVYALLLKARKDLEAALANFERQNFGNAKDWIEAALKKLPVDNGVHIVPWPSEADLLELQS